MRALMLSLGLVAACAAAATQLTDDQLRAEIVGVWYCEALRDTLHHNGGRLQYFPDGLFIADYRISSVASEQYVRTRGRWSVDHGVFTETANYVAGTDESVPKLARQIVAIDRQKIILAPAAGGGARFHHLAWKDEARSFRAFDGSDTEEAFDRARSDAHERLQTQRFRPWSCLMATRQQSDRSCEEEMRSNQSMKPTALFRCKSNVPATPPCLGLSLSR